LAASTSIPDFFVGRTTHSNAVSAGSIIDVDRGEQTIDIRLIAIDMDGTLLGSDGLVSRRNVMALRDAEQAGLEIVIATGRRHCYAMKILRDLDLRDTNALVSSNGTVIRTIGARLLDRTQMPVATARRVCEHMKDFRDTLVLTFDQVGADGEDTRGALVVEDFAKLAATIDRWVQTNAPFIAEVKPLERALEGELPIQMMVCGKIARMREAEAKLMELPHVSAVGATPQPEEEITLHRTEYADKDLCILDILPAGCSKASALERLASMRGCSMTEVMAIGDNWNDVPMLRAAGRAVLMANAPNDVQQLAQECGWQMALSNDEDGVAAAIYDLLRDSQPEAPQRERMLSKR
jgi:Cof subfamily protein (haloacid dehalogenase superfamily)